MTEQELRQLVRDTLSEESRESAERLDEGSMTADRAQNAREKLEREVEPELERLVGIAKAQGAKSGWAESILEDAKDLYQELSAEESRE